MDSTSSDHIFNSFAATTRDDWQKAAVIELDGADPFQKLAFESGGLSQLPYYDQQNKSRQEHFQLKPSTNEFLGARSWINMPQIDVNEESHSNQTALFSLNSGADGIIFNVHNRVPTISALLEKLEWPYCTISFAGNISEQSLKEIHAHALEKKYDVTTLAGCVFRNQLPETRTLTLFENWSNFHPLGTDIEKKESPAEEIATALAQAVRQIDFLTEKGFSVKQALQWQGFKIQIEEDFFLSIAKLKTLRLLWNNVVAAFDSPPEPVFIHATSPVWNKKEYQPNGNMLKSTTAALSAILGGCDALTIFPEENNNTTMTRIAQHVSTVLREESHQSKVADPTAGSYYLESLINQLAAKAWEKFQKMS